jgi:hypothetical protein
MKIGLVAAMLCLALAGSAAGLTQTDTRGRVCPHREEPCRVETFSGGYTFKGATHPSLDGQIVKFSYKRRGDHPWHKFGRRNSDKAFISLDGTPYDELKDHHFRERFDINGFEGFPNRHWILRAKFIQQDGYEHSVQWVRVTAHYGD